MNNGMWGQKQTERERGWKGGFSIWSWGFSKRLTVAEKRREIFFLEASDKSRSIL